MYKHILISTDGSETAQKGVDHGLNLAKSLGARVTILTVTEALPVFADAGVAAGAGWFPDSDNLASYAASSKEAAGKILAKVAESAAALGVAAETIHVPEAVPAEAIVETARTHDCSLIVMSSHGRRGLGRLILGSQTAEVLAHSAVPVLVVR